ncbi:hypothetical protein GCM10028791_31210 [Echinicola sediminis]
MDIQSYIASGKLELFVLGELSEREQVEVIELSKKYPEIKKELEEIQDVMFAFDDRAGVAPSMATKERVFDTLEEEFTQVKEVPLQGGMTKEIALEPWKKYAVAASVVAVLAIGAAVYFAVKFYDVEERFSALLEERNILVEELDVNKARFESADQQLETLLTGNYQRIPMRGEAFEIQKDAKVDVYWDKESQEVFISVGQLAGLEENQDYQLWAIGDEGPVGIGIIKAGERLSLQQMEAASSAGAFAITIEPKGGSEAPTLENLVVLGEVV